MTATTEHPIPGVWVVDAPEPTGRYTTKGATAEQVLEEFHKGWPDVDTDPTITPGGWDAVADLVSRGLGPIVDTCEWESYVPEEANQGGYTYQRVARRKAVGEVLGEIRAIVGKYPDGAEDYLSVLASSNDVAWPEGRIVVYAIHGSNEGDYVHIEVHVGSHCVPQILGKTFMGRDAAWLFARKVADLLGA